MEQGQVEAAIAQEGNKLLGVCCKGIWIYGQRPRRDVCRCVGPDGVYGGITVQVNVS